MDPEEQIMSEVVSSAAQAAEVEATPSEPMEEVTPAASEPEVTEPEQPAEQPKDDFYKSQYENLLKDYTRKSQTLAEIEKTKSEPEKAVPWEDPNYQPKDWKEVYEMAKQATLREVSPLLSEVEQARQQKQLYEQAQKSVNAELAEIKATDPKANEDLIFKHANKYGFSSLKSAYQNLKDMRELDKTAQQKVIKNLKTRAEDPIGVSSATPVNDDTPTYQEIASSRSIRDAAANALARIKGNE